MPGLRFAGNIQRKGSHRVAVVADKVAELEGIASGRDNAMAGVEGGLRKCSTETARTTGNEPNLRPGVHPLIVADRHGRWDWPDAFAFDQRLQHGFEGDLSSSRAGVAVLELNPAVVEAIHQALSIWAGTERLGR
jgi:hypothetical protein